MGSLAGFGGVNAFSRPRSSDLGRVGYKTQQMLEVIKKQHPDSHAQIVPVLLTGAELAAAVLVAEVAHP